MSSIRAEPWFHAPLALEQSYVTVDDHHPQSNHLEVQTMSMPAEQHEHQHDYKIVVNGREKTVDTDELNFEDVLHLAFDPVPSGPNWVFTVTYRHAAGPRPNGTLVRGETVKIKDGTVFHATATDKS